MKKQVRWYAKSLSLLAAMALALGAAHSAPAAPVPGGSLDPTTIPKYVTPLVIPPVMPKSTASAAPAADYDIAVRQFKQQILPGGIWGSSFPDQAGGPNVGPLPATTIWSYGRAEDPLPDSSGIGGAAGVAPAQNSTFNYPALTVENTSFQPTNVRWINDLVDPITGNYLPHLFNVDQSLHWANPPNANCMTPPANRTDCHTMEPTPYTGPVPLVTHVHGAHVQPESDGYPEAWWLPNANNIPGGYAMTGSVYTQSNNANAVAGSAYYSYDNTQPATTLWYHDHALGMTRLNVYAGPAGFWLIRGGTNGDDAVDDSTTPLVPVDGTLPGPAPTSGGGDPNFDPAARATIREIPLAIQDRSFNSDGSLFYPADRSFFDGFTGPYIGDMMNPSDISGIWNPEAFFNTMVVNGTTWPKFEAAQARYRLRLLNGCNSRTLNLSMFVVSSDPDGIPGNADDVLDPLQEVPFYQIGAEQGFLPKVVMIQTGKITTLPGNGTVPAAVPTAAPEQAMLMGPAERADVIVDFSAMANGTRIRMINTAPDGPFGGFPDVAADPLTSGQVMDFVINSGLNQPADANFTPPKRLRLPAERNLGVVTKTRKLSLNELSSDQVCIEVDPAGAIVGTIFSNAAGDPNFLTNCDRLVPATAALMVDPINNTATPMGPRQAQLGVMATDGLGNVTGPLSKAWSDPITEIPLLNSKEVWEIYNTTMDAHPIHLHLVRFEVIDRQDFDMNTFAPMGTATPALPNEAGYKDTVMAYPGQITRIRAKFDIAGLYVWHCHIVEHEDNEMMRPFIVASPATGVTLTSPSTSPQVIGTQVAFTAAATGGSGTYQYRFLVKAPGALTYTEAQPYSTNAVYNWDTATLPAGAYSIQVQTRNDGSTRTREASKIVNFGLVAAAPATAVILKPVPGSPQTVGTSIAFTATASGGAGPYEYRFLVKAPGVRSYTEAQPYGANLFTWNTGGLAVGNYNIQVQARTVGSALAQEAVKVRFFALQ